MGLLEQRISSVVRSSSRSLAIGLGLLGLEAAKLPARAQDATLPPPASAPSDDESSIFSEPGIITELPPPPPPTPQEALETRVGELVSKFSGEESKPAIQEVISILSEPRQDDLDQVQAILRHGKMDERFLIALKQRLLDDGADGLSRARAGRIYAQAMGPSEDWIDRIIFVAEEAQKRIDQGVAITINGEIRTYSLGQLLFDSIPIDELVEFTSTTTQTEKRAALVAVIQNLFDLECREDGPSARGRDLESYLSLASIPELDAALGFHAYFRASQDNEGRKDPGYRYKVFPALRRSGGGFCEQILSSWARGLSPDDEIGMHSSYHALQVLSALNDINPFQARKVGIEYLGQWILHSSHNIERAREEVRFVTGLVANNVALTRDERLGLLVPISNLLNLASADGRHEIMVNCPETLAFLKAAQQECLTLNTNNSLALALTIANFPHEDLKKIDGKYDFSRFTNLATIDFDNEPVFLGDWMCRDGWLLLPMSYFSLGPYSEFGSQFLAKKFNIDLNAKRKVEVLDTEQIRATVEQYIDPILTRELLRTRFKEAYGIKTITPYDNIPEAGPIVSYRDHLPCLDRAYIALSQIPEVLREVEAKIGFVQSDEDDRIMGIAMSTEMKRLALVGLVTARSIRLLNLDDRQLRLNTLDSTFDEISSGNFENLGIIRSELVNAIDEDSSEFPVAAFTDSGRRIRVKERKLDLHGGKCLEKLEVSSSRGETYNFQLVCNIPAAWLVALERHPRLADFAEISFAGRAFTSATLGRRGVLNEFDYAALSWEESLPSILVYGGRNDIEWQELCDFVVLHGIHKSDEHDVAPAFGVSARYFSRSGPVSLPGLDSSILPDNAFIDVSAIERVEEFISTASKEIFEARAKLEIVGPIKAFADQQPKRVRKTVPNGTPGGFARISVNNPYHYGLHHQMDKLAAEANGTLAKWSAWDLTRFTDGGLKFANGKILRTWYTTDFAKSLSIYELTADSGEKVYVPIMVPINHPNAQRSLELCHARFPSFLYSIPLDLGGILVGESGESNFPLTKVAQVISSRRKGGMYDQMQYNGFGPDDIPVRKPSDWAALLKHADTIQGKGTLKLQLQKLYDISAILCPDLGIPSRVELKPLQSFYASRLEEARDQGRQCAQEQLVEIVKAMRNSQESFSVMFGIAGPISAPIPVINVNFNGWGFGFSGAGVFSFTPNIGGINSIPINFQLPK